MVDFSNPIVPNSTTPNPYAPQPRSTKSGKRATIAGESRLMVIGSILVSLAAVYPGTIWLAGWWTEQYRWQPSAQDWVTFYLVIGPLSLAALFTGFSMFVPAAISIVLRRKAEPKRPMSFGRFLTVSGFIGTALMGGELALTIALIATTAQTYDLTISETHSQWFPPSYVYLACGTLAALLLGWIFTPRAHPSAPEDS